MEAFLTPLIAAGLSEMGGRTQLLAALFAARYRRPGPVLAALTLAALANSLIAAFAGQMVGATVNAQAMTLMVALALLFAGAEGLWARKSPDAATGWGASWRTGPFVTSAVCLFLIGFGDRTQFLTLTLAGRFDSPGLATAGASLGMIAAGLPAILLAARFADRVPVTLLRRIVAGLFLLAGFLAAIAALRLT